MGFGNGVVKFLSSNLFARLAGYPAIIFGFSSDAFKAWRQNENGNSAAAAYTFTGGVTTAIGSAVILEAGLAIAGPTVFVPFAGWAAAALVLAGAAILAGGLYLHAKAHERLHSPIELWTARSIFGNRINDGEIRSEIILDHYKKLPPFHSLHAEIKAWHDEHYRPRLLSAKEAQSLGVTNVDTQWHQHTHWNQPNWSAIKYKYAITSETTAEFTVLLPGFAIGASQWSGGSSSLRDDGGIDVFPINPAAYVVDAGLILHIKLTLHHQNHVSLHLAYSSNRGLTEGAEIHSNFHLER